MFTALFATLIATAIAGVAISAAGVGVNAKINKDNVEAQKEINDKQIELSERQYQRSTATNQKYELVKAGLSEQQARQNIAAGTGSGSYATPTLTAPVQQPLDFSNMVNSLSNLGGNLQGFMDDAARPDGGFIGEMLSKEFISTINDHIEEIPTEALRSPQTLRKWIADNKPEWSQTDDFKKAMRQAYTQPPAVRSVGFYCQNQAGYENMSNNIDNIFAKTESERANKVLTDARKKLTDSQINLTDAQAESAEWKVISDYCQAYLDWNTVDYRKKDMIANLITSAEKATLDGEVYSNPAYRQQYIARMLADEQAQTLVATLLKKRTGLELQGLNQAETQLPEGFAALMTFFDSVHMTGSDWCGVLAYMECLGIPVDDKLADLFDSFTSSLSPEDINAIVDRVVGAMENVATSTGKAVDAIGNAAKTVGEIAEDLQGASEDAAAAPFSSFPGAYESGLILNVRERMIERRRQRAKARERSKSK